MRQRINPEVVKRIRDNVTMDDVLGRLGLGPVPANRKIRSIFGSEKTPSLHVYGDHWYDYSTGRGGDQIDFVMAVTGKKFTQAVQWLASGSDALSIVRREELRRELPDLTARFHAAREGSSEAWGRAVDLFDERWPHLDFEQIVDMFRLKVTTSEIWIPHYDGDIIRGIKRRGLRDGAKYAVRGSCFTQSLYFEPGVEGFYGSTVALVEGESDTWSLAQVSGYDVVGLPTGAGTWREEYFRQLEHARYVFICLDGDDAGNRAARSISQKLEGDVRHEILEVPGGRVAEAVAAGWMLPVRHL